MDTRLLRLPFALFLAFGVALGAHAQSSPDSQKPEARSAAVLPILNMTGKFEGVLLLEPTGQATAGARWHAGRTTLDAAFGLDAGNSLGLVCNRTTGLTGAIGNLANHCLLAAVERDGNSGRQITAGASLTRDGGKLGLSLGNSSGTLPAWLSPSGRASEFDQNTLTLYGQKNIGREATVSIGGTLARARLIPAGDVPTLADRWTSRSLTVGAGYGDFGASIIGRVVETPGLESEWRGLGIGLTWNTPWSGQLTVGAENVVTRGKNPFAPANAEQDEGTVPYVRYEQDL